MKIEIKSRWNGEVLYQCEAESLRAGVLKAVSELRILCDANLSAADLSGANLRGADLCDANLCDANLSGANLSGANLRDADLSDANLSGANLSGANLRGADLCDANLCDANLSAADLSGANLRGADLSAADLTLVRDDLWAVLCSAPKEAEGLSCSIAEGRIAGSVYEGECACLIGTLANVRHCHYDAIPGLRPNPHRPAERFFLAINIGDTPETSQFSKLALNWVDEWLQNMRSVFGASAGIQHTEKPQVAQ